MTRALIVPAPGVAAVGTRGIVWLQFSLIGGAHEARGRSAPHRHGGRGVGPCGHRHRVRDRDDAREDQADRCPGHRDQDQFGAPGVCQPGTTSGSASRSISWSRECSRRSPEGRQASQAGEKGIEASHPGDSSSSSRNVDLIAGTMTDAPQRRADVDFSLTFFVTGGQFLVKEGSPIRASMTLRASVWVPWCTRPTPGSSASRRPRRSWSSSRSARRLPGARAGKGRCVHQRRRAALRSQVHGARPERLRSRGSPYTKEP